MANTGNIARTTVRRENGEYIVRAYGEDGGRMSAADYFTTDRADAYETARRMTEGVRADVLSWQLDMESVMR